MGLSGLTIACCTRNRPREVERLVASVVGARASAKDLALEFLVLDDGKLAEDLCRTLETRLAAADIAWRYHNKRERAGLLNSRIEAVKFARHDWLSFLDDDVEIAADYLARLSAAIAAQSDLAGIGGVDLLSEPRSPWRLLVYLLLGLEPLRPGQLSFAGFPASMGRVRQAKRPFRSQRVYGSNMTFRREALAALRPLPGFHGYSLGEDAYLSFAALESGELKIEPALLVKHHHSPGARDNDYEVGRMSMLNHWLLMRLYGRPSWRPAALLLSLPALIVMSWVRVLLPGRGTDSRGSQFARGQLSAWASLWRGLAGASDTRRPDPEPERRWEQ